jgi:hypothetical protein
MLESPASCFAFRYGAPLNMTEGHSTNHDLMLDSSKARQKYHAATERYGRHFSPILINCFGVGNFRRRKVLAKPFRTP